MPAGRVVLFSLCAALALAVGFSPSRHRPAAVAAEMRAVQFETEKHADLAYRDDPEADVRHRLDLYVPVGSKNFPVMIFIHGGGWKSGSKTLYAGLGRAFARHGIGVAVINYRLSPKVKHPVHAEDAAKAFAWVRANVAKYGGDAGSITIMGHSAGGHLAALLALDPRYLKAEKLEPSHISGVVAVSGVYQIDPAAELYIPAFGTDPDDCRRASPMTYVKEKHPPFLIAYADNDYESFDRMAIDFHAALEKAHVPATLLKLERRTHISEIISVLNEDDPLNEAIRKFIRK